jgi:hypothetical protein
MVEDAVKALHAPQAPVKEIVYDRETRDYAMYYEGALVGFAKTYQVAQTTLDTYVFELLTHTAVESADQAADVAAMEAETTPADDLPLAARAIPLTPGAHELDDGDVKAAYWAALHHREMQPQRWQNALKKAFDHLREDRFVVAIGERGAYCWWPEGEGGSYAAKPGECQCTAFLKDQPCKHVAASRILLFLPVAEDTTVRDEIDHLYRLVMDDVMRLAA